MKIAIYIHSLGTGGAERVTTHLANYWDSTKHDVIVITNAMLANYSFQLNPNIKHLCLGSHGSTTSIVNGAYANCKRVTRLRKIIKENEVDVLVSFAFTANVTAALACMNMSTTAIGSERNYPPCEAGGKHWHLLRKFLYRYLSEVVVQTSKTKQWIQNNTNAKKVTTIPNPNVFPLQKNSPFVQPPDLTGKKVILGVGRFDPQKQFSHLIEAFAKSASNNDEWVLIIVGEGQQRKELEHQISALNLDSRTFLPGSVGNISDWYEIADIFVLSSKYEGFPNVLMEAMAHELAVISYDCDTGPSDLIEHNKNGKLVAADNTQALSEAITTLIINDDTRTAYANNAVAVRTRFGANQVFAQWDSVLADHSL